MLKRNDVLRTTSFILFDHHDYFLSCLTHLPLEVEDDVNDIFVEIDFENTIKKIGKKGQQHIFYVATNMTRTIFKKFFESFKYYKM